MTLLLSYLSTIKAGVWLWPQGKGGSINGEAAFDWVRIEACFRTGLKREARKGEATMPAAESCAHVAAHQKNVKPRSEGCEECLTMGDTWVHLRMCLECGHVGCCDSSKNKHATAHFHQTRHPIMRSIEPGEHWRWCYVDEIMLR
jgi:uncharacterized UBP type Zn finger protein